MPKSEWPLGLLFVWSAVVDLLLYIYPILTGDDVDVVLLDGDPWQVVVVQCWFVSLFVCVVAAELSAAVVVACDFIVVHCGESNLADTVRK